MGSEGLLRPGLLGGVTVVIATRSAGDRCSEAGGTDGEAVCKACSALGARARLCQADGDFAGETLPEDAGVLVLDGPALFERDGLSGCLASAWQATHAIVNRAFLAAPEGEPAGGRIVYLAPRPGAGPEADAARAGLENLARTLSIEWARHSITTVTIAPSDATTPGEAAGLAAYLASPAGAYFSGCQLDLRGPLPDGKRLAGHAPK